MLVYMWMARDHYKVPQQGQCCSHCVCKHQWGASVMWHYQVALTAVFLWSWSPELHRSSSGHPAPPSQLPRYAGDKWHTWLPMWPSQTTNAPTSANTTSAARRQMYLSSIEKVIYSHCSCLNRSVVLIKWWCISILSAKGLKNKPSKHKAIWPTHPNIVAALFPRVELFMPYAWH